MNKCLQYGTKVKVIDRPDLGYISGMRGTVVGAVSTNDDATMYIIDFDYYPYTCAVVPESMFLVV